MTSCDTNLLAREGGRLVRHCIEKSRQSHPDGRQIKSAKDS